MRWKCSSCSPSSVWLIVTLVSALQQACSDAGDSTLDAAIRSDANGRPSVGEEQGDCYPNGTCNGALACLRGVCVQPDAERDAGPQPHDGGELPPDAADAAVDGGTSLDAEQAADAEDRDGEAPSDATSGGAVCGDNIIGGGEQCDDGNAVTESCAYGLMSCTVCTASCTNGPGLTSFCGDGQVDGASGEQCDDGNSQSNDGCSSACVIETSGDCSSLSLDGIDDLVVIPDGAPATSAFTLEAWIQGGPAPSAPAYGSDVLGTRCGRLRWAAQGFHVEVYPACNGTGTRYTTDSGPALPFTQFPNGWYHVALVVPAQNQARIYVNGQLVASSNSLLIDNGVNGQYIGTIGGTLDARYPNTTYNHSALSIASFRASQIARYTQAFTPPIVLGNDANTSVLYDFSDGSGTLVTDASNEGRNGTLRGGPAWSRCPVCGNGTIDSTESCDDGNTVTESCLYGQNACTVCNAICQSVAGDTSFCGDGRVAPLHEQCDDGNAVTEACVYGQTSCTVCTTSCTDGPGITSYCGNGQVDGANGEQCDDGNTTTEACNYGLQSCVVCSSACRSIAGTTSFCGDGTVDGTREQCDDGNAVTEACVYGQTGCTVCTASCTNGPGISSYCGNGQVDGANGEQCDDGNTTTEACNYGLQSCVVCSSACRSIAGATSFCGDGLVDGVREQCDDGNAVTESCAYGQMSCTVCTANCANGSGITSYCGNGQVDGANGEQCDDGNTQSNDGCSSTCVIETFADCSSLNLDGVDDLAVIPDGAPATSAFTLEAWIQGGPAPSAPAYGSDVLGTRCGRLRWATQGFHVDVYPACNGTGTRYTTETGPALPFTQFPSGWYHVALVVLTQNQARVYVNGQLVASSNSLLVDNGVNGQYIGTIGGTLDVRYPNTTYNHSAFSIASFRASQVARYTQAFTPPIVLGNDANTSVLYDFSDGSGTIVTDASGAGRNGTLRGSPAWSTQGGPGCSSNPSGPCADGTTELGASGWGRSDIAFCQLPGSPAFPLRMSEGAAALCGAGWHVCTTPELTARNDGLVWSALFFGGTIDDGDDCFLMNLPTNPGYNGSVDAVRSGFPGSCSGSRSGTVWGRQQRPNCGSSGTGACGVICCL